MLYEAERWDAMVFYRLPLGKNKINARKRTIKHTRAFNQY